MMSFLSEIIFIFILRGEVSPRAFFNPPAVQVSSMYVQNVQEVLLICMYCVYPR